MKLFSPFMVTLPDYSYYVQQLRDLISKIKPVPFCYENKFTVFVHPNLEKWKRVYLRVDRVHLDYLLKHHRWSFYCSFQIKEVFKIRFYEWKEDTVSIDRLKLAYLINYDDYGETDEHSSLD